MIKYKCTMACLKLSPDTNETVSVKENSIWSLLNSCEGISLLKNEETLEVISVNDYHLMVAFYKMK